MTVAQLIMQAQTQGLVLTVLGDRIKCRVPRLAGIGIKSLLDEIRLHKTEVIEALQANAPHPEPMASFFPSPQPEPVEWLRKPRTVRFMTPKQRNALQKKSEIAESVEALKKELARLRELETPEQLAAREERRRLYEAREEKWQRRLEEIKSDGIKSLWR